MEHQELRWRKSSRSGPDNQCIELTYSGQVRDSKNPHGPTLTVDLEWFVLAVKGGRL